MNDDSIQSSVDLLFTSWDLRNTNPSDAASVEQMLRKRERYNLRDRAVRNELRGPVQEIYREFASGLYAIQRQRLLALAEPLPNDYAGEAMDIDEMDKRATEEVAQRKLRAKIVVQLMLQCAPYLDVKNWEECLVVAATIADIANKGGATDLVSAELFGILKQARSPIRRYGKTDGQILAIAALTKHFDPDVEPIERHLLDIVRSDPSYYVADVQIQAMRGLIMLAAENKAYGLQPICIAFCDFLLSNALGDNFNIQHRVAEMRNDIVRIGEPLLDEMITFLHLRVGETIGRQVFTQVICYFEEEALTKLLRIYYQHRMHQHYARPLAFALRVLVRDRAHFWLISVPEVGGRSRTLFDVIYETLSNDLPASDIAAGTLGYFRGRSLGDSVERGRVIGLLRSQANNVRAAPQVRANCLIALVVYMRTWQREEQKLSQNWVEGNDALLAGTAALLRYVKQRTRPMGSQVVNMILNNPLQAARLCAAVFNHVRTLLEEMLDHPEERRAATQVLKELHEEGHNLLARVYLDGASAAKRLVVIRALRELSTAQLRRVRDINSVVRRGLDSGQPEEVEYASNIARRLHDSDPG